LKTTRLTKKERLDLQRLREYFAILKESLPLVNGKAALLLGTEEAGVFLLKPADEAKYCAAGQSVLIIEVV